MSPLLLIVVPAVVATAILSGVFGMGGGTVLMIVYVSVLPTASAMVLHGVTQLASNGSRALLLLPHAQWRPVRWYVAGALISVCAATAIRFVPSRAFVFLALGVVPIAVTLVPRRFVPSIERPGAALVCGALATAAKLTAGVSGPLLDAFFVQSSLDRRAVVATKALTQTFSHGLKLIYFGSLMLEAGEQSPSPAVFGAAIVCAFVGTAIGRRLLERVDERRFRRWSAWLVWALGVGCVARGLVAVL